MSAPAKPISLDPRTAYLHITSPQSPSQLSSTFSTKSPDYNLHYVGPVGELKGEHVFEVRHTTGTGVLQRDSDIWRNAQKDVLAAAKEVDGVKGVKVLDVKQRAKRSEF